MTDTDKLEIEKTLAESDAALEKNPNDAEAMLKRALCYQGLERYEEAVKEFDRVIALRPDALEAYNGRGLENFYLGNTQAALKDFHRLALLGGGGETTAFNIGLVLAADGKFKDAKNYFDKAFKKDHAMLKTYYKTGEPAGVVRLQKKIDEILAVLKTESDKAPNNFYLKNFFQLLAEKHKKKKKV
jgi:tetratricopeptide (TPR) repeat protein